MYDNNFFINQTKSVSIIIVSWNVKDLLRNCIASILEHFHDLVLEIIVIDNRSSDESVAMLKREFPTVKIIENEKNVGFSQANNQGISIAQGEFIFILNPDTIVTKNSLNCLINEISNDNRIGLVGPKLVYPDGRIQSASARKLPSLSRSFYLYALRMHKLPFIGNYFYKKYLCPYDFSVSQYVEAISGAAMLSRGSLLKDIGGFDPVFIHTGEDVDLCYRITKKGFLIKYLSDSIIIHYAGESAKKAPVNTAINSAISVEHYFKVNYSIFSSSIYKLIVQFIETPITVFVAFLKLFFLRLSLKDFLDICKVARGIMLWRKI